jgi:hypothetical protein
MVRGAPWDNNSQSLKNEIRALNSLLHLSYVLESTLRFDCVLFLRPDMQFLQQLPIQLMVNFSDRSFLPDFHRSCTREEYNDRMMMGNLSSGIIYGKKLLNAYNYSLHAQLHPELFNYHYISRMNIPVIEVPFRFRRIRAGNGNMNLRDRSLPSAQQQIQQKKETINFLLNKSDKFNDNIILFSLEYFFRIITFPWLIGVYFVRNSFNCHQFASSMFPLQSYFDRQLA